jgi:hypothetical protein
MLDIQIFGMNAGLHHCVNLVFHIVNAVLLFFLLNRMTGTVWRSAMVAALFALHPLHVESVVWLAERKDLLSTLFWMLTLFCYARYAKKSGLDKISSGTSFFYTRTYGQAHAGNTAVCAVSAGLLAPRPL